MRNASDVDVQSFKQMEIPMVASEGTARELAATRHCNTLAFAEIQRVPPKQHPGKNSLFGVTLSS